jgi:hypothetical protein
MLAGSAQLARLLATGDRRKPANRAAGALAAATVSSAGDVVAREVLRADAANHPPIAPTAPAKEGDPMSTDPGEQRDPSGTDARTEPTPSASPSSSAARTRGAGRTTRERAEEKRQAKLELVQEQVQSGSLVIRQMTEEERRSYPPRAARPTRGRAR